MSVHDQPPARKHSRLGLYLPFVLLAIGVAIWSGVWIWARGELQRRMDAAVADLNRAGYRIGWSSRSVGGYPFRLEVRLTEPWVREPSGWALQAPLLEGEAYLYAPTHWMMATPQGLTFVRPIGGPVTISGRVIRASLSQLQARPPSLDVQGLDLTFKPAQGADPFFLSAAKKIEFHLRAGPDDQGGVFASVESGDARLSGLFARVAGTKPISIVWNSTVSKMSAFEGPDWAGAVRHWADAGGTMTVRQGSLTAGEAMIKADGGTLSVGRDGRLRGELPVSLRQAPKALGAMGEIGALPPATADAAAAVTAARQAQGDTARATITFQAGQTTLGPVALGPAPKVYEAR